MKKHWFGVAVVTAAALGCAMAAESLAPKQTPAVILSPPETMVMPVQQRAAAPNVAPRPRIGAADRASFTNRNPLIAAESNILAISAAPIPNDLAGVKAEQEKVREALLAMARQQIDMQVAGTQQMRAEREAHDRRSASDPETAKLRARYDELERERQDIARQINERLEQDPEYQRVVKQRQNGLQQLRDMSGIMSGLQNKQDQLLRRQAQLERQAEAAAATNSAASPAPVTVRQ